MNKRDGVPGVCGHGCAFAEPEIASGTANEVVTKAGTDRNPAGSLLGTTPRYGKEYRARQLKGAVEKIVYPGFELDHSVDEERG